MSASISIYLDKRSRLASGNHPLKLRVTYQGQTKLLPVEIGNIRAEYSKEEYERATGDAPRGRYRTIRADLDQVMARARLIAADLDPFTLSAFEERWREKITDRQDVFYWFDRRVQNEQNPGTEQYYDTARKSFQAYCKCAKLRIHDITPDWLRKYEAAMIAAKKSPTTVSIYTRALQSVWHDAADAKVVRIDDNPFGRRRYKIKKGRNVKKSLTDDQLERLHAYRPANSLEQRAQDLFLFMFHMQGINVGDVCRLTWANVDEASGFIKFERQKTKERKRSPKPVTASLNSISGPIFERWKEAGQVHVFPFLRANMSAGTKRNTIKNLTNSLNRNLKKIAERIGLPCGISTNYARHSFATRMKRQGRSIEEIAEMIGSSVEATQHYLDSFEPTYLAARANTEQEQRGERASD